ncbi:hypothetical protein O181_115089 [Austropuccinia psidii MF-1]|uniref:Uncharacterized protein n=1 Tax=Austropuccinia psidii MF-1 TaxID=1389203 RepID=A0A9Q3PV98_9BASI|nr:hypothetical protein [Austropuccinia psidii MF-1]
MWWRSFSMGQKVGPMDPLETQHIWVEGASNSRHGPQTANQGPLPTECVPWPADCRTPINHIISKRKEMALNQKISRLAIVMARTKNHQYRPKWSQSHSWAIFQGQWGQDPSFDSSRILN